MLALNRPGARNSEQYKIVHVAAVALDLEFALDEMIKRVEIDQRVHLAQQVADRNANRLAVIGEQHHHIHEAAILDLALDQAAQDGAFDTIEKLPDIELEGIAIARAFLQRSLRIIGGLVRAVADAAGERLIDKDALENRRYNAIDGMLHNQVAEGGRVDAARLRLVNHEAVVRHRMIAAVVQLLVQVIQIAGKVFFKIEARALAVLVPRCRMESGQQRRRSEGDFE